MRPSRLTVGAALVGAAFLTAALAHAGERQTTQPTGQAHLLRVVERDFHITVTPKRVAAGDVVFRVTNRGPDAHELIVVRTDNGLPLRPDGITVDEDAVMKRTAGSLEPAGAGRTRELHVRLTPGRYTLFCNMYGHFMGGMHAVVVVQ